MKVLLVSEHWYYCTEPTENKLAEFEAWKRWLR